MFIKDFIKDSFSIQAAGLAYNSLLAIIPTLAVIFAISEGFNISDILKQELYYAFPGQEDFLNKAFVFVNSYLDESRNGLFLGIGLLFLLWTVISLIRNIENTFNQIYNIRESRSVAKQITHYLAMVVLIPVFIVLSSGLSVFIVSYVDNCILSNYLSPMVKGFSELSSFGFILLSFLFVYKVLPNKEIKFWDVLIPAILAAAFFQVFQLIYISGQIWVGKYNAIYGSFAAIPLLLLWLQVSWTICIYGAKLAYNIETSRTFRLEEDKENISLLDKEFLTFLIMYLIKDDFKNRKFTKVETLSQQIGLTQKLVQEILDDLQLSGLVNRVISGKKRGYQPAFDPSDMTYSKIVECLHSTELHPSIEKLASKYPFILQFINEKQLWIKGYEEEV
ncbi:MAG: YihY/virulence factor BrkB family protein [Bacteroidales bacterium]